ncbi:MAG TPA: hypothetical protein VF588_19260 [Pyrinomonadaceae bacterium]|jgi:hypothetical protein
MRVTTINGVEEHTRHIGEVYQKYYPRLRNYFTAQLGDTPDADACVQETVRRFFFFMEDRCWEADAEFVPVYLMRIAGGLLCSKMSAGAKAGRGKSYGLFDKIKGQLLQPLRARPEMVRLFLGAVGVRQAGSKRAFALRRATATSV